MEGLCCDGGGTKKLHERSCGEVVRRREAWCLMGQRGCGSAEHSSAVRKKGAKWRTGQWQGVPSDSAVCMASSTIYAALRHKWQEEHTRKGKGRAAKVKAGQGRYIPAYPRHW